MNKFKNFEKKFWIMPTLETAEAFSYQKMEHLANILEKYKSQILSIRIGGNDLLNVIGVRRPKHRTIHETPIGNVISNLISIFKPLGYNLTSPVCEFLYDNEVLLKELPADLDYGLFGKTAIHPDQIKVIESFYKVSSEDLEMAEAILDVNAKAVFNMHGTMCEVATHFNWAIETTEKAKIYGIYGKKN
jgi:citrate lyase beta subunit